MVHGRKISTESSPAIEIDILKSLDLEEENECHNLQPINKKQDLSRKSPSSAENVTSCLTYLTLDESLHKRYGDSDKKKEHRVKFDKVSFREYPICLGNNPAVSRGAPLTIDWEPMTHVEFDLVEFHDCKMPARGQAEMFLPKEERDRLVKSAGHSRKEIMKMVKDVNVTRLNRKKTIANLKYYKIEKKLESAKKKISKIFK